MLLRWVVSIVVLVGCGSSDRVIDISQSQLFVEPPVAIAGVDSVEIRVVLRDTEGAFVEGETVTLAATGTNNVLGALAETTAHGESSTTWTSTKAELKTLSARVVDGTVLGIAEVTFVPGSASQLRFTEQPLGNEAGGPFRAVVAITDAFENVVTDADASVTVELGANPGAASFEPIDAMIANGVAELEGLAIAVPASGYTLRARTAGFPDVTSAPFDIVWGEPSATASTIVAGPHSSDADGAQAVSIDVVLRNQYGVALVDYPVAFSVSGSGNALEAAGTATDELGAIAASLRATVAEPKVITATAGPTAISTTAYFYEPPCTLQLPMLSIPQEYEPFAFASADVDGDGNADAVEANGWVQLVVRRGRGDGRFHPPVISPLTGGLARSLYLADVTNDNRPDAIVVHDRGPSSQLPPLSVMRGNGDGSFSTPQVTPLNVEASAVAIADFDRDGMQDLVVVLPNAARLEYLRGNGDGTFSTPTTVATLMQAYLPDVVTADLDGNGTADLVTANDVEVVRILGNGDGTFGAPVAVAARNAFARLRIANLDNDVHPDVLVVGDWNVYALRGSSTGDLTVSWQAPLEMTALSVAARDLDGDGDDDFVIGRAPLLRTFSNNGDGTFIAKNEYVLDACRSGFGLMWRGGLALADLDGDSRVDLLSTCQRRLEVIRGGPNGTFEAPVNYRGPTSLFGSIADFNGDGRSDLVASSRVLLMQPNGSITLGPPSTLPTATDGATADLNGDGRQDLVLRYPLVVGLGNGDGSFESTIVDSSWGGFAIELADMNNDGKLDVVASNLSSIELKHGDGAGDFGAVSYHHMPDQGPVAFVTTDLNSDNNIDIVIVRRPYTSGVELGDVTVLANVGDGTVIRSTPHEIPELLTAIATGDFNGDAIPDIAVLGRRTIRVYAGPDLVAIGAPYELDAAITNTYSLDAVDLDGDGALDLIASTSEGYSVLRGFSDGYFRAARDFGIVGDPSKGAPPVFDDFDDDGDVDFAFSTGSGIALALQGTCIPHAP